MNEYAQGAHVCGCHRGGVQGREPPSLPGGPQAKKETRKHWARDLGAADHQLWRHTRTSLMCSANKH